MSTSMRCRTAPAVTRELVVPADANGDRESVCLGERRTETLPGNTTCTRHAAQLWCCHTQSGASVMRARSVWGASLPHAVAVCARQRIGAAPGACTPAAGQRWSARKEARGGAARTSLSGRAPQPASLRPGAVAPEPWSRDRSPGIASTAHSRPCAWQRRAASGDPGSAPRTGGGGPPPPDSGAATGSRRPLARVARRWCTTLGMSPSVVSGSSCCRAPPCYRRI
jgi:hypothetical protein